MSSPNIIVHATVQSGFDWGSLLAGVLGGLVPSVAAYLALRHDRRKDNLSSKMDRLDTVQELLLIIVDGIVALNNAYKAPSTKAMVDGIDALNKAFMLRLQKIMSRFVGSTNELKEIFIKVWDGAIEEREKHVKPIQNDNQRTIWDTNTGDDARRMIAAEIVILVEAYGELIHVQKRLVDEIRPRKRNGRREETS